MITERRRAARHHGEDDIRTLCHHPACRLRRDGRRNIDRQRRVGACDRTGDVGHHHRVSARVVRLNIIQRQRCTGGPGEIRAVESPLITKRGRAGGGDGEGCVLSDLYHLILRLALRRNCWRKRNINQRNDGGGGCRAVIVCSNRIVSVRCAADDVGQCSHCRRGENEGEVGDGTAGQIERRPDGRAVVGSTVAGSAEEGGARGQSFCKNDIGCDAGAGIGHRNGAGVVGTCDDVGWPGLRGADVSLKRERGKRIECNGAECPRL